MDAMREMRMKTKMDRHRLRRRGQMEMMREVLDALGLWLCIKKIMARKFDINGRMTVTWFLRLTARITPGGGSEYRIDGKQVSAADYQHALEKHNILIKARNFLVFQVCPISVHR
jgi:hypothetical protein